MHRPKTCSQNGQSVEMPENEKIFPAAKFCQLRVQSPKLPLTACSSKSRKKNGGVHHFSACLFVHSVFRAHMFSVLQDFEFSAHVQSDRFEFFDE